LHSIAKRVGWACLLGSISACGGAPAPDLHAAFRRIQVQEAVIAHGLAEMEACAAESPCPARGRVCEAANEVCALAEENDDVDARARCELARRRCASVRGGAS
jgi:hypothetical protein